MVGLPWRIEKARDVTLVLWHRRCLVPLSENIIFPNRTFFPLCLGGLFFERWVLTKKKKKVFKSLCPTEQNNQLIGGDYGTGNRHFLLNTIST